MTDIVSISPKTLIASQRVEGKTVYDLAGHKLGKIDDILIEQGHGCRELCSDVLWRLSRYGQEAPSVALGDLALRSKTKWLCRRFG